MLIFKTKIVSPFRKVYFQNKTSFALQKGHTIKCSKTTWVSGQGWINVCQQCVVGKKFCESHHKKTSPRGWEGSGGEGGRRLAAGDGVWAHHKKTIPGRLVRHFIFILLSLGKPRAACGTTRPFYILTPLRDGNGQISNPRR